MSYNKRTWATGNVVGAVDLNRIENGIADIDVDEIRGWSMQSTQLFSETVTTADNGGGMNMGVLVYSQTIDSDTITVTFNNTNYTCPRVDAFGEHFYGGFTQSGPDFSQFPFAIESGQNGNALYTQTAGTYTISAAASTAEVSSNFVLASKTATTNLIESVSPFFFTLYSTTWQEVYDAMLANRLCVRSANDGERIDIYIAVTADSTDYSVIVMNPLQGGNFIRYEASSADDPLSD